LHRRGKAVEALHDCGSPRGVAVLAQLEVVCLVAQTKQCGTLLPDSALFEWTTVDNVLVAVPRHGAAARVIELGP
jgi:hypothetical protein